VSARHTTRPDEPLPPGTAAADVHAHTRRSDGVLEPAELVRQAHAVGIRLFAIADHDNLAAYRELTAPGAAPLPAGMELVPAVEINAVTRDLGLDLPEGELHVLGIGVDPGDDAFEAAIAAQRGARRARFAAMVERLREVGLPLETFLPPGVRESDDALGRPTLARALVEAGFADTVDDAFQKFLGHGRPGYVPRTGMNPVNAIRAIRAAGGLASLAHFPEAPTRLPLLRELMAEGLNGLETHHRWFGDETRAAMTAAAGQLGLVRTGGSDYHGDLGPYAETHAQLVMPDDLVTTMREAISGTRGGARIAPARDRPDTISPA
jgi:predicted metal-dependent phosphoesterase TrpH